MVFNEASISMKIKTNAKIHTKYFEILGNKSFLIENVHVCKNCTAFLEVQPLHTFFCLPASLSACLPVSYLKTTLTAPLLWTYVILVYNSKATNFRNASKNNIFLVNFNSYSCWTPKIFPNSKLTRHFSDLLL